MSAPASDPDPQGQPAAPQPQPAAGGAPASESRTDQSDSVPPSALQAAEGFFSSPAFFAVAVTLLFFIVGAILYPPEGYNSGRNYDDDSQLLLLNETTGKPLTPKQSLEAANLERILTAIGANDEDEDTLLMGLNTAKALAYHLRALQESGNPLPQLPESFTTELDALLLDGIRNPQSESFDVYLETIQPLMGKGDKYHTAILAMIADSDDDRLKAQLWYHLFLSLGPQPEVKPFILQTLHSISNSRLIAYSSYLAQSLLDEDFIDPLAAIAINPDVPHYPRHQALEALAAYGAKAQRTLPLLQGLPDENQWPKNCRERALKSIRNIEKDTPERTVYPAFPDDTPRNNIDPLW